MLIKSIPSDVELYILEFLIMPLDIKRLKKVSRSVENMINNTKYIIENPINQNNPSGLMIVAHAKKLNEQ